MKKTGDVLVEKAKGRGMISSSTYVRKHEYKDVTRWVVAAFVRGGNKSFRCWTGTVSGFLAFLEDEKMREIVFAKEHAAKKEMTNHEILKALDDNRGSGELLEMFEFDHQPSYDELTAVMGFEPQTVIGWQGVHVWEWVPTDRFEIKGAELKKV